MPPAPRPITAHPTEEDVMAGKSLKGTKSHENLKEAFAGESQANRRYLYFARVADIEGFPDIAGLFKDTADAATGAAGETYEYTQMDPGMAKTARDESFAELAEWFETLAKAEKSHAGRFNKGLPQIAGKGPAGAS